MHSRLKPIQNILEGKQTYIEIELKTRALFAVA